jgi:glutamine---fructose-6-phosphate transaminase (isomerizing)
MKSCSMLDDILRQPESLRRAWSYQMDAGSEAMLSAARTIREARRVVLTGMGSSLFAAMAAASYLERHGRAVECIETSELLHFLHASLNRETTVVVISRSGESVEALKLLPLLAASGARVVGVTNVETSRLAREVPIAVMFGSGNDRMVSVQSYTSSVAVLLLLAARILEHGVEAWPTIDQLSQQVALATQAALDDAPVWVDFFSTGRGIYFLGRGASLASAHESALLMHEAARTPVAALSSAQFRHGPVEVTSADTRAVIFSSQGPTRELDLALAADLRGMGAEVRLSDGQGIGDPFAPVIEIVPVQAAACALALHQGLDPGDFRYATLVTATETGFKPLR